MYQTAVAEQDFRQEFVSGMKGGVEPYAASLEGVKTVLHSIPT